MNVYCLTSFFSIIQNATAYVEIKGELSFGFYPIKRNAVKNINDNKIVIGNETLHKKASSSKETTAAAEVDSAGTQTKPSAKDDCVYQYPDRKLVEALHSDMMNQLTKIFVRAFEYLGGREARRGGKRFQIVSQRFDSRFFKQAYNIMNEEYRESINASGNISTLLNHDPCRHQTEVKEMWRSLLEQSKAILKRAAVRCVSDFLRVRNRADDTRTKEKVSQLLIREIKEVRSNQLKFLCDNFKLCYKDLLY